MTQEEYYVALSMKRWGGSFVQSLAECFFLADDNNITRLKNAFPEYWTQYSDPRFLDKVKTEDS